MFDIVVTVYNEYELLRQFVESIWINLDTLLVNNIIIVDDYSNTKGKLREYEEWLGTQDRVKVINHNEYRYARYYQANQFKTKEISDNFDYRVYDSDEPNMGHPTALWKGVCEGRSKYVLCSDTDIAFLSRAKGMFNKIADLFEQYEMVMAISQCVGVKSNEFIETEKPFLADVGWRISRGGGYVSPMLAVFRRSGWDEHNLDPFPHPDPDRKMGWVYNMYHLSLFASGFTTLNYPIFSKGAAFHVGKGSGRWHKDRKTGFGFCRELQSRYGPRVRRRGKEILADWYAGRYILDMSVEEYRSYLTKKYKAPFDILQEGLNERLLYTLD